MTYEKVKRPNGSEMVPDELIDLLVSTKEDGQAVKIKLDKDVQFLGWQANVRNRLRKLNLKLRVKFNKGKKEVTAWVEDFQ